MRMAIDKKKVVERLKNAKNKKKYTFAINPTLMDEFKLECEKLGTDYGPTIEELIKEFLGYEDSTAKKK